MDFLLNKTVTVTYIDNLLIDYPNIVRFPEDNGWVVLASDVKLLNINKKLYTHLL
jgi:hypothetical protein